MTEAKTNLKLKTDNLFWEFNTDTQKIDILWILKTEDGRYYQRTKSISPYPLPRDGKDER